VDSTQETSEKASNGLHPRLGWLKYWKSTANALADQFDCLLYDMRFGRSRGRAPKSTTDVVEDAVAPVTSAGTALTYELEAEDLAALLNALHLERVSQWSLYGASIATLLLNRYPEQVEGRLNLLSLYDEKAELFQSVGSQISSPMARENFVVDRMFMDFFYIALYCRAPCFLEDF